MIDIFCSVVLPSTPIENPEQDTQGQNYAAGNTHADSSLCTGRESRIRGGEIGAAGVCAGTGAGASTGRSRTSAGWFDVRKIEARDRRQCGVGVDGPERSS